MTIAEINRRVIERYRAGGEIEGMHRDRILLLTTTGARTGRRRTTPVMFHRDRGRLLVAASNAGAPKHPDWYRNLVADPRVTVEAGGQAYEAVATTLEGADRARAWARLKRGYPFFASHEARAGRVIPVVALTPVPG